MHRVLVITIAALLLSACAVGNKHDYRAALPALAARSPYTVAVAVQDRRPYVVDGEKTPDFVGLQRGGYGNPFDVATLSGQDLAGDITIAVNNGLEQKGITTKSVAVAPQSERSEVIKALVDSGAQKSLLLTLDEWKSDTYVNIAMIYNLSAEVFDDRGQRLAENRLNARENIDGSFWNAPSASRTQVPEAYRRILERLLNDEEIVGALK